MPVQATPTGDALRLVAGQHPSRRSEPTREAFGASDPLEGYSVNIVPIIVGRGPPPHALTGFGWLATRSPSGRRVSPEAPKERRETGAACGMSTFWN